MGGTTSGDSRCVGIVGGLGVGATIHYYQELVAAHAARGGAPRLLISHADLRRVLDAARDNDRAGLSAYLSRLIVDLSNAGAEIAAIAAVTPHICAPDLVRLSPLPLVDLVEEVARVVRSKGLRRVAMFGTRFAVESGFFGRLKDVEIVQPKPEEVDDIHNAYLGIVSAGRGSDETVTGLHRIAHTLCQRDRAQAIILAGTELSLVFNETNTDFPSIDCARVHIDAIVRQAFN